LKEQVPQIDTASRNSIVYLSLLFICTGCLKCYAENTVNLVDGKTMQDLHQATMEKISYRKDHGYGVIEVWECEIRKELDQDEDLL
jgi:hypothetical protein